MTKRKKLKCFESCVCQKNISETKSVCSGPVEYHHIKTFGSGGPDHIYNLMPLCRKHHRMVHDKGNVFMSRNFHNYYENLLDKKWEINPSLMKWVNYEPEVSR